MKKIMFMMNSLDGGGAEKVLQTLLRHLDRSKYDITLYSMHRENIAAMDYPSFVHYKVVFDQKNRKNRFLRRLDEFAGKIKGKLFQIAPSKLFYALYFHEKFDVEIAFIEGESTKIVSGSTNRKSKKYAWVHIDLQQNPWTDFLYHGVEDERRHYNAFDRILCVSQSVQTAFLDKYRVPADKVMVQYNPVDREEIRAKAEISASGLEKSKFRMVAVGRLVHQKGFDRLIEIAAKLRSDGFDFEILILGEGEDRALLETMIQKFGLEHTVYLMGFQSNPYAIMATADLLVCSSRAEGFSTVVTEGVILGLPVVSTDCAGIRELFGEAECGIVTKNDTEDLYRALKSLLCCRERLEAFRLAALKRGDSFSLTNTMKGIENILNC